MLDLFLNELRLKAAEWNADADRRRKITSVDPVADTRAYDAQELLELAQRLDKDTEEISAATFAKLHRTTTSTVTAWARKKKIPARMTTQGWMIRRDTPAPNHRHVQRKNAKRST